MARTTSQSCYLEAAMLRSSCVAHAAAAPSMRSRICRRLRGVSPNCGACNVSVAAIDCYS
jgi:hypothetical protein